MRSIEIPTKQSPTLVEMPDFLGDCFVAPRRHEAMTNGSGIFETSCDRMKN